MQKGKILAVILTLAVLTGFGISSVQAAPVYVGSYAVYDGPDWKTNPPVYSAREAAALIFGGSYTDYAISINSSLDPLTITFTGWYDGWAEHDGMIFDQDYKLDEGNPGYNDPYGIEGTARSAYVQDGLFDTVTYRNYVWTGVAPVPGAVWLLGSGLLGLLGLRRKFQA